MLVSFDLERPNLADNTWKMAWKKAIKQVVDNLQSEYLVSVKSNLVSFMYCNVLIFTSLLYLCGYAQLLMAFDHYHEVLYNAELFQIYFFL